MTGLALYCLGHESTNRDLITHHKMFSDIQSFLFLSSLSLDYLKYTFSPTGVQVSLEPGNSKSYPMLSSMTSAPPWPYPSLYNDQAASAHVRQTFVFLGSFLVLLLLLAPSPRFFSHSFWWPQIQGLLHLFPAMFFKGDVLFMMLLTVYFLYHFSGVMN